jgi:hypothetical protein
MKQPNLKNRIKTKVRVAGAEAIVCYRIGHDDDTVGDVVESAQSGQKSVRERKKQKQKKNVEELPKVQATTPCGSRRESDTVLMRIDPFGLGDDTDGLEAFTIDESTGTIRTKVTLDHEERAFYRLAVSVKDHGRPPKETVRQLQIEVLDLNDNRPTFSTSSFAFKVSHVTRAGHDGFSLSLSLLSRSFWFLSSSSSSSSSCALPRFFS